MYEEVKKKKKCKERNNIQKCSQKFSTYAVKNYQ